MCGVATTCGRFCSRKSTVGSFWNTSSAAPATWPGFNRVGQRRFVNQVAACGVDQADALLRPGQPLGVDEVAGLLVARHVERHVVGAREEIVERHQLDAEVAGHLLRDERVVRDDAHAERRGAARDLLADPAEPGEAERLVAQLFAEKLLLLPLALLHRRIGGRQVAREREHLAERQLGDADAVRARRVHDDDAAGAGGGDVDVVDAGAGAGNHPQARRGGDDRRGHLGGAANDNRVGVGEVGGELVRRAAGTGVDLPSFRAQQIERGSGKIIGDNNFHGFRKYNLRRSQRAPCVSQAVKRRTTMVQTAKMLRIRARFMAAVGSFQQGFQQKLCVTCGLSAGHRPKRCADREGPRPERRSFSICAASLHGPPR